MKKEREIKKQTDRTGMLGRFQLPWIAYQDQCRGRKEGRKE
jgi:hypothetical protein